MNLFSWTQGSVAYSLHMYRFATVVRVLHMYGCCLLLSLNSSLPRNARPAPAWGSTVFSRKCTAEPGHNACACPLKFNVPGLFSGTPWPMPIPLKPLTLQNRMAGFSFGLIWIPIHAQGVCSSTRETHQAQTRELYQETGLFSQY